MLNNKVYFLVLPFLDNIEKGSSFKALTSLFESSISISKLYIYYVGGNSNHIDINDLLNKGILLDESFDFSNINGQLNLIFSKNNFASYNRLIELIISNFKPKVEIIERDENDIIDEVIKFYYVGNNFMDFDTEDLNICMIEYPKNYISHLKENIVSQKDFYILFNILDDDIFMDNKFLYFKYENIFYKINKWKVIHL